MRRGRSKNGVVFIQLYVVLHAVYGTAEILYLTLTQHGSRSRWKKRARTRGGE